MSKLQGIISVISDLVIQGKTNRHIAHTLNEQGYRTPGKGCLWTAPTVIHFRLRNHKEFEDVEQERLRREWALIPMPRFPRLKEGEMLVGVPFFDTGFDGALDLSAPVMRRTR